VEHLVWLSSSANSTGISASHSNASTSSTSTKYFFRGPVDSLQESLVNLYKLYEPLRISEQFALEERGIVVQERRRSMIKNPALPAIENHRKALYPEFGLGRSVLGVPVEINDFSLSQARQLHELTHSAKNSTLLISGNLNKEILQESIGKLQIGDPDLPTNEDQVKGLKYVNERISSSIVIDGILSPLLIYSKLIPLTDRISEQDPLDRLHAIDLLREFILSASEGSLVKRLSYNKYLARSIQATFSIVQDKYIEASIVISPVSNISSETIVEAINATFRELSDEGISLSVFDSIKARSLNRMQTTNGKSALVWAFALRMLEHEMANSNSILTSANSIEPTDVQALISLLAGEGREVIQAINFSIPESL
jgi:predicted Zn-dependent peptidase